MSDERKYYCLCDSNCRFETMTKEQILAAIAQAISTGKVYDADAAVISKVKESNSGDAVTFWAGTQVEYNALTKLDAKCIYIITDSTWQQDLVNYMLTNFAAKGEDAGMVQEFDSGSITATEYTYAGNKAKLYTVLVNIDGMSGGTTLTIDRAHLTTEAQMFSVKDAFSVNAYLDDNGFPHFAIADTLYINKLRRVCGYY